MYLSFVTDAYSRKIIGYHVAETLEAVHSLKALQMAINNLNFLTHNKIVHHSDRGIQYCSEGYVSLLEKNHIQISMTENGDPLENPIAERINGIIKDEYLRQYHYNNIKELEEKLSLVIPLYNNERPHSSCSMFTPAKVYKQNLPIERKWKTYYRSKSSTAGP